MRHQRLVYQPFPDQRAGLPACRVAFHTQGDLDSFPSEHHQISQERPVPDSGRKPCRHRSSADVREVPSGKLLVPQMDHVFVDQALLHAEVFLVAEDARAGFMVAVHRIDACIDHVGCSPVVEFSV